MVVRLKLKHSVSDWANVIYKTTDYYSPVWDRTILWNDPFIGIDWPLIEGSQLLVSEKDTNGIPLMEAEIFD